MPASANVARRTRLDVQQVRIKPDVLMALREEKTPTRRHREIGQNGWTRGHQMADVQGLEELRIRGKVIACPEIPT
jgi:hypothetical protein